jgi:O-antigen/teichoic acid export membrane protein
MMQFCWPLWLSAIAGLYIGSSGALFLRAFDTLSDVGRLQLALKFAVTVGMLLWAPFQQHWEPMSFKYYREPNGKQKFQLAFITISALMFIGGLAISIFAEPVIKVMAAKPFYAAADVVPIFTLALVLDRLRTFFDFGFMITDHTKMRGGYQYATALVLTIAYVVLIPRFGLVGAAAAQCVTFVGTFICVYFLARRYFDPEIKLLPIGIFSAIGIAACLFTNVIAPNPNLIIDLVIKLSVTLIATALIAIVALREIRAVDVSMLDSLPWPLHRLGRIQLGRLLGNFR